MKEINLPNLVSRVVQCETRELRATWTRENITDIYIQKDFEYSLKKEIIRGIRKEKIKKIFSKT